MFDDLVKNLRNLSNPDEVLSVFVHNLPKDIQSNGFLCLPDMPQSSFSKMDELLSLSTHYKNSSGYVLIVVDNMNQDSVIAMGLIASVVPANQVKPILNREEVLFLARGYMRGGMTRAAAMKLAHKTIKEK